MRTLSAAIAVAALLCAGSALAGEKNVSNKTLAKMGLSGLKPMSDAEGMQVRGMAGVVSGASIASVNLFGSGLTVIGTYNGAGTTFAAGRSFTNVTASSTLTAGGIRATININAAATGSSFAR